ncbi:MAG: hypothetical protein IKA48_01665 [Fibrobacter sp.]|nr:hypothetical protein [Fibrobacter sp.]
MIARVKDDQYLNIFEVVWLFLAAEFIVSMNFLRLYDIDTDEWHYRRIFWTIAGICITIPVLVSCVFATVAAVKYLW